jgi:hypothetical protein
MDAAGIIESGVRNQQASVIVRSIDGRGNATARCNRLAKRLD